LGARISPVFRHQAKNGIAAQLLELLKQKLTSWYGFEFIIAFEIRLSARSPSPLSDSGPMTFIGVSVYALS